MDKPKSFAIPAPKTTQGRRVSTISATPSTSRSRAAQNITKVTNTVSRPKVNKNATVIGDGDSNILKTDALLPEFDSVQRQVAYSKFLRTMLEECLVDEKIKREETQIDIQMGLLADRFQSTIGQLDKTSRRLKDITFVAEHERLLALKNKHCNEFYTTTEKSNAADLLHNLDTTVGSALDKLQTKNIDFGYNKETGHKQLLDAVNEAIEGLEQIKKNSSLDSEKFKEYNKSEKLIDDMEKVRFDLDTLKTDFNAKYPQFVEKLLKEASERISKAVNDDDLDDDDDD